MQDVNKMGNYETVFYGNWKNNFIWKSQYKKKNALQEKKLQAELCPTLKGGIQEFSSGV